MHIANIAQTSGNAGRLAKIIQGMDKWSYAHRIGNGQFTDQEQQKCINKAFWDLKEIVEG